MPGTPSGQPGSPVGMAGPPMVLGGPEHHIVMIRRPAAHLQARPTREAGMVEYAFLNAAAALKLLGARVVSFAAGIDWMIVAIVVGGLVLLRLVIGGRRRRI